MIWFTSDYHLGHANIIRYCGRPFADVEEMDRVIIENHNSTVGKMDTVFYLGDLCFSRIDKYWHLLNGNIIFIEGNHDRRIQLPYRIKNLSAKINGKKVFMTHRDSDISDFVLGMGYDIHLVGHSHDVWKFKKDIINVGCDVWNFKPIKFDYMMKEYRRWGKTKDGRICQ
jgi:calcineurin-like phosphoesterase family protein